MTRENVFSTRLATLRPKLVRFCNSLTHNEADAEDLAHETIARVMKRLEARPDLPMHDRYVLKTARNAWIDLGRRKSRNHIESIDALGVDPAAPPVADALVTRSELESLLHLLPAKPFVIVLLCDVFGFTAKETGARIRTSEGSVQVALSRARSRPRRLAGDEHAQTVHPRPERLRLDLLLDAVTDAFRRRDPELIHTAYLRLFESGSSLLSIRSAGERLSFTFSDPDGNLLTVVG